MGTMVVTVQRGVRWWMKLLLAPLVLTGAENQSRADPADAGPWWVVLGTSPAPDATGLAFPAAWRAGEAARRCGVETMGDFSAKFTGFAPDLYVTVAGGYPTRAEAVAALERARPCVPGAYLKRSVHAGG